MIPHKTIKAIIPREYIRDVRCGLHPVHNSRNDWPFSGGYEILESQYLAQIQLDIIGYRCDEVKGDEHYVVVIPCFDLFDCQDGPLALVSGYRDGKQFLIRNIRLIALEHDTYLSKDISSYPERAPVVIGRSYEFDDLVIEIGNNIHQSISRLFSKSQGLGLLDFQVPIHGNTGKVIFESSGFENFNLVIQGCLEAINASLSHNQVSVISVHSPEDPRNRHNSRYYDFGVRFRKEAVSTIFRDVEGRKEVHTRQKHLFRPLIEGLIETFLPSCYSVTYKHYPLHCRDSAFSWLGDVSCRSSINMISYKSHTRSYTEILRQEDLMSDFVRDEIERIVSHIKNNHNEIV